MEPSTSASAASCAPSALGDATNRSSFSRGVYEDLRRQVAALKQEHRRAAGAQDATRKLEALALQRIEEEEAARERDWAAHVDDAQRRAREAVERSVRTRVQLEKEKKALQARADKLAQRLQAAVAEHAAELAQARAAAAGDTDALQKQLADLQTAQDAEREQWQQERGELERRAAAWCQAEVDQERQRAAEQAGAAQAAEAAWRERCDVERAARQAAEHAAQEAAATLRELEAHVDGVEREARCAHEAAAAALAARAEVDGALAEARAEAQQRERNLAEEHARELHHYRQRKDAEIEALHARVRDVVAKKDAGAEALRTALAEASARAEAAEAVLRSLSQRL